MRKTVRVGRVGLAGATMKNRCEKTKRTFLLVRGERPAGLVCRGPRVPPMTGRLARSRVFSLFTRGTISFRRLSNGGTRVLVNAYDYCDFYFPRIFVSFVDRS